MEPRIRRGALRKVENAEAFPLIALQGIREVRTDIDEIEAAAILRARELGASLEDIAEAIGITRQGVAYRLKHLRNGHADEAGGDDVVDLTGEETELPRIP